MNGSVSSVFYDRFIVAEIHNHQNTQELQEKLAKAEAAAIEDRLAAETKALSIKQTGM